MIKFFRNIRQKLLQSNKLKSYSAYALGEIFLVVLGILIALQINNWNEERKDNARMLTYIKSIAEDITSDTMRIGHVISELNNQSEAAKYIIPIMESNQQYISDSLKFILEFNKLTTTQIINEYTNTWTFLNSSGLLSEFPDPKLIKMLQDYYNNFNNLVTNFTNSAIPARLEIRRLKYELFTDTEHRKFFPTTTPVSPNASVYNAIFEDKRVLPMARFIGSTANYFEGRFISIESKGVNILNYISVKYK
jgi:hypothetical protein